MTSASQSCDQHLGWWCHHSISKSDDEEGVFLLCQLSNGFASFHRHEIDAKEQRAHSAINLLSCWSIYHKELNFCITSSWELFLWWEPPQPICVQYVLRRCDPPPPSLTENRAWWKGERAKRAKINNLFYLMGWSVVVMRQAWMSWSTRMPKCFPGGRMLRLAFLPFPWPLSWQGSHREHIEHLLPFRIHLWTLHHTLKYYVRIWEPALSFIRVLVLCTMSLCLPPLDGWFPVTWHLWIVLPNSCIGNDLKDIGLWRLSLTARRLHRLLNESLRFNRGELQTCAGNGNDVTFGRRA